MASLHHIHIKAGDPHRSAAWWAETFGASVLPSFEAGGSLVAPVEVGGTRINLSRPGPADAAVTAPAPAFPHYGLEHLGLIVADLGGILDRLEQQGLSIHLRRSTEEFEVAFVSSPDGVLLELLEPRA